MFWVILSTGQKAFVVHKCFTNSHLSFQVYKMPGPLWVVNVSQIKLHLECRESDDPWVVLLGNSLRDNKYYYPVILSLFFSVLDNFFLMVLCVVINSPLRLFFITKKRAVLIAFCVLCLLNLQRSSIYNTYSITNSCTASKSTAWRSWKLQKLEKNFSLESLKRT